MTAEEVMAILKGVKNKKAKLYAMRRHIDSERYLLSGCGAIDYSKVMVKSSQGNAAEDRYAKMLDRIQKLEEDFTELCNQMQEQEDELRDAMESLPPEQYAVILDHYMNEPKKTVGQIAVTLYCSEETVKYRQKIACKKLAEIINKKKGGNKRD